MATTVKVTRGQLHDQYIDLRMKIVSYYRLLPLVGREAGARAYKLPPKLGHWHASHSERVRAVCPELESTVQAIEVLSEQRAADAITTAHIRRKRGGKRRRPIIQQEYELVGEWPPRKY